MKVQSKILVSIVASVAVAAVIALIAFSILSGMNAELERSRMYDQIITKTYALNVLVANLKEGPDQSAVRQVNETLGSLDALLKKMTSAAPREEALIRQLQNNNEKLGPVIDQMLVAGPEAVGGIEKERRNILASQIWMQVRFISDDTNRLNEISQERIISALGKAGTTIVALIIILALAKGIIYFLSGRSIVRAQDALQESEERLRVTLSSIGDAVIATDASGRVTFVNPTAATLTGRQLPEAAGQSIQSIFKIINEQTRRPAENIVDRVLREGRIVNLANHTALVTHDGREIPIEDSAAPIMDSFGNIIGVVVVFHDVTEKRHAREQIETISRFPDENPDPILRISNDGRLLYANRNSSTLLRSLNWEPGQTLPEDWRQHAVQTLESGSSKEMEVICGEVVYSLMMAPVSDLGYLNIYGHDITERKRSEEELLKTKEEAERRAKELESLMDAVPALIWISRDAECLSMTGNRAVYEFLGMPVGANVSKTASEVERPVHFKALRDGMEIPLDELPMQQAAKGRGVQNYEMEYAFDDGTSKITLGNTTPLHDASGHVYGAIAAFVDITERKQAEARQAADLTALTRLHELSGRFLETGGLDRLLQEIMDAATVIMGAQMGTLQLLENDSLRIVASHGHKQPFLEFFDSLKIKPPYAGRHEARRACIVWDVETSSLFAGTPSLPVMVRPACGRCNPRHWSADRESCSVS